MFKHIFGILFILSVSVILISASSRNQNVTQAIITIPELVSCDIQEKIEQEFESISGVRSCNTSLMTSTMTLQYDDRKLTKQEIEKILEKWGCFPDSFKFHKFIP